MKRFLWSALGGVALTLGLSAPALADDVTYPGNALQTIYIYNGGYIVNCLAPTGTDLSNPGVSPSLTGNTVTVTSDIVLHAIGAINFNNATVPISNNSVTIQDGTVNGNTTGAFHWIEGDTDVQDNSVIVNGGTLSYLSGGLAQSEGDGAANASGNTVTINGGTLSLGATGGDAENNSARSATASGNTVIINGGAFSYSVYAGSAMNSGSGAASATGNTVRISGAPVFAAGVWIGGGYASSGAGTASSSGNTLQMATAGVQASGLLLFQKLDFQLADWLNTSTPVLTVGTANLGSLDSIAASMDGAHPATLEGNAVYTLISAAKLNLPAGFAPVTGTLKDATGLNYDYTVQADGNDLVLKTGAGYRPGALTAAAPVPTASHAVLTALALLLAGAAMLTLWRRHGVSSNQG
jgi:hypothetical protein